MALNPFVYFHFISKFNEIIFTKKKYHRPTNYASDILDVNSMKSVNYIGQ